MPYLRAEDVTPAELARLVGGNVDAPLLKVLDLPLYHIICYTIDVICYTLYVTRYMLYVSDQDTNMFTICIYVPNTALCTI